MRRIPSAWRREVGFLTGRPRHLERLAVAAQRISGVGLLAYLGFHVAVTGSLADGWEAWEAIMASLAHPLAHVGELLVLVGATFHAVNGVRIMLLELTPLVGRPTRPDYPYVTQSLGRGSRSILYTAMFMSGLAGIVGVLILWGS
jgi:succinate dehydrogenase cytochrome b556 subunit